MASARPLSIPATPPPSETYKPQNIVAGEPLNANKTLYENGPFSVGLWTSTKGKWTFESGELDEFCVLLEGHVILTPDGGAPQSYHATNQPVAFVIPAGFKGSWETVEPLKKWYCCYQPPKGKL